MSTFAERTDQTNLVHLPISLKARDAWMRQVLGDPGLVASAKVVAQAILLYLNREKGKAWPAISTLAVDTTMSERGVKRALHSLQERGHLGITSGRGCHTTNDYSLRLNRVTGDTIPRGVTCDGRMKHHGDGHGDAHVTVTKRVENRVTGVQEIGSPVAYEPHIDSNPKKESGSASVAFAADAARSACTRDLKEGGKRSTTTTPRRAEPPLTADERDRLMEVVLEHYSETTLINCRGAFWASVDCLFLDMERAVPRFRTPRIDDGWNFRGQEVMREWARARDDHHLILVFASICKVLYDRVRQGATVISSMAYFTDAVENGATL